MINLFFPSRFFWIHLGKIIVEIYIRSQGDRDLTIDYLPNQHLENDLLTNN